MSRSSSLSPEVLSSSLPAFIEAKSSFDAALASYRAENARDDTKKFLEVCFKYLPLDGQVNLSKDVCKCSDVGKLRQLAANIDTGLLRPLLSNGGRTPAITSSPRLDFDDDVEDLHSLDMQPADRSDQDRLRQNCLRRDGYQCVLTKCWTNSQKPYSLKQRRGPLRAVHILPFALGNFTNDDVRRRSSMVWTNIFRYFPSVRSQLAMSIENVNKENNMMMLFSPLHEEFGGFHLILEPTETPNRYRVKTFPSFSTIISDLLPRGGFVTLTSHVPDLPLPAAEYLQLHAAIGNILHASGRGELIAKLMRGLRGAALARDGSSNVGDLLSVSGLSLLASNPSLAAETASPEGKKERLAYELGLPNSL